MTLGTPIRIVFCITELDPGGAERALVQLVVNLNRDEWAPHVVCLGPRGHFSSVLEAAKIPVICLNARGALSLPRVLFQLTRELRRLRPALVQTFLFHANIVGRIAARLAGVPVVVSGLRVAEHRSPWYGRLDCWTNFLVSKNVCVSQGVATFSERQSGLKRKKIVVIPNAVDVERFANAQPADMTQFGIPNGSRIFILIGRLEYQKGVDVFIDAVLLMPNIPDDVYFLVIGDGPDASHLRAKTTEKNLTRLIHFVGRRNDIPELLAASMALILPSRWEGMPNVVLEAMAAKRPVIAARVEGIDELVLNRVTGLTVLPEQPAELAGAIQEMIADRDFTNRAGQESYSHVVKHFTETSAVSSYTNLYRELLF